MADKVKLQAGFALEGGVMFASKNYYAIAKYKEHSAADRVKASLSGTELDEGLDVTSGKVDPPVGGTFLSKIPFIAGIVALITSIVFEKHREPWTSIRGSAPALARVGALVLIGIVLSVLGGFSYLVGSWIAGLFGVAAGTYWYGFLISMFISVGAVGVIVLSAHSLKSDMLNFHGAEHKVGNAFRKKLKLTKENVSKQSRFHTNCSINLVVNSSIVYPFIIAFLYVWLNSFVLAIIVGLVACASINVELLRFSTIIGDNPISYVYNFFGLLAQRITVREPEERHLDAAIAAMNKVLELERGERD